MLTAKKVSALGVEKLMAVDVCKKLSDLEVGTVIEAMEAEVRPSKFGDYVTIKGNQLLRPGGERESLTVLIPTRLHHPDQYPCNMVYMGKKSIK